MKLIVKLSLGLALFAGTAAAAPQELAGPDQQAVTDFKLTTAALDKFSVAADALVKATKATPGLNKQMQEEAKGRSLAEASAIIEKKYPTVSAAIQSSGLSTRDFLVMTVSLLTSGMAVGMKQQGMIKELPPSITPANAAFIEKNMDRIGQIMQKMQSIQ